MQRNLTWVLSGAAGALLAFILLYERHLPGSVERQGAPRLFPTLQAGRTGTTTTPGHAGAVNSIEVTLAGGGRILAVSTNSEWRLAAPEYEAQQSRITGFLGELAGLRKLGEVPSHQVVLEGPKAFGLDPPQAVIELRTPTNRIRFLVGGRAPLTNNIYLRLEPAGEVVLADGAFLQQLPQTTNDWRSTALLSLAELSFDHVQIRQRERLMELARQGTNQLWQLIKPVPARADQSRMALILERLRAAQVEQFVADGPAVNLEGFGLQNPELELAFLRGTNEIFSVEFGAEVSGQTNRVYARLLGAANVVAVGRELPELLRQPYRTFHDPQLVTLDPGALDRILIRSIEEFALQRQKGGSWVIESGPRPALADPESIGRFLNQVTSLRILDIARDIPTEADLHSFGFLLPVASFSFFERLTNAAGLVTNILFTDISFGTNQTDRIHVRRSDEPPIYVTPLAGLFELPRRAFELRDRSIWNFDAGTVARITVRTPAGSQSLTPTNRVWSPDALVQAALEETLVRLGQLRALEWVAQGEDRKASFGLAAPALELEIELAAERDKPAQTLTLWLGKLTMRRDVYAAVPPLGEDPILVFQFPGELYQMILRHFPVPN